MSSRTFYSLVLFDMIFLGFLFLYNSGTNPNPQMNQVISDVFAPWTPFSSPNCTQNWWDVFIPASCTAETLASILLWGFKLIGEFFFKIGAFGTLVIQVFSFTLPSASSSVPFLNYILVAFQTIIVFDGITVFRGASSGV